MAIIPQLKLFGWDEIEQFGDLERLRLVLNHMPDEELMVLLEKERGKGRNDYPVRAMWNSILAGIVFQHGSIESLRRELSRNGQLRDLCGFICDGRRDIDADYGKKEYRGTREDGTLWEKIVQWFGG